MSRSFQGQIPQTDYTMTLCYEVHQSQGHFKCQGQGYLKVKYLKFYIVSLNYFNYNLYTDTYNMSILC